MNRDVLSRSLKVLAEKIERLERQRYSAGIPALSQTEAPHYDVLDDRKTVVWVEPDPHDVEIERQRIVWAEKRIAAIDALRANLDDVGAALREDGIAWETERAEHDRLVDKLLTVRMAVPVTETAPILSEVIDEYITAKRVDEVMEKHLAGLPRRFQAFIDYAGDKPLDKYNPSDLTKFAADLAKVPIAWSMLPELKEKTIKEAISWHEKRVRKGKCFTAKTVQVGYIVPVKALFNWACIEKKVQNPFGGLSVRTPKSTRKNAKRQSFTNKELTQIFRHAATEKRLDDRLLPILGFFTGARIAELTSLQARDFKVTPEGHWYIDLGEKIIVGEKEVNRSVKTEQSIRYIALHDFFKQIGFIDYIKAKRPSAFIFPHLHSKNIIRPSDTASKRMSRLLKDAGVYQEYIKVFHSFRHTASSFYKRDLKMRESLIRRHMGHITKDDDPDTRDNSSADIYGNEPLKDHEIKELATVPLPDDIDFLPYIKRPI